MAIFKCKMCGGTIEFNAGDTVGVCDSCGTKQTLPRLDDDRKANLYDRANHFRRNNEYDKAMGIYEQILNEDNTDAEAYWSIVLCKYGIEYVEDPSTHKRVPTVNRAQYTSIFADVDYKSAIEHADGYQKGIYEAEAKTIDEIQKGILEISQNEEPFDVFICYKETGNDGRRTPDSVLATELYHELTREGFKVFFSRITLEDKLGTAYEPYIFAALNSAKVMVVIGTKAEYFNAVWVKNEWSRFLSSIKNGERKTLIPAYKDMDPYDLPEEFSHLQAQDMSKLGFMNDLVRGINKIINNETLAPETANVVNPTTNTASTSIQPIIERAYMFLEDKDWNKAVQYSERALDIDPKCADAYFCKFLASKQVSSFDSYVATVKKNNITFEKNGDFQKAKRFADAELKTKIEQLEKVEKDIIFATAVKKMNSKNYEDAISAFNTIKGYKNSEELIGICSSSINNRNALTAKLADNNQKLSKFRVEKINKQQELQGIIDSNNQANINNKAQRRMSIPLLIFAILEILVLIGLFVSIFFIGNQGEITNENMTLTDKIAITSFLLSFPVYIGFIVLVWNSREKDMFDKKTGSVLCVLSMILPLIADIIVIVKCSKVLKSKTQESDNTIFEINLANTRNEIASLDQKISLISAENISIENELKQYKE